MRRSPVSAFLALALGLALPAGAARAQQGFDLKAKVPPQTLLYASFPNLTQSVRDFQSMPLAKLWREEEVQDFLAQPLALAQAFLKKAESQVQAAHENGMIPLSVQEILSLRPGNLSFALIGPGGRGEPVRFALSLGFVQGVPALDKLVQFGLEKFQDQIQKFKAMGMDEAALPKLGKAGDTVFFTVDTTQNGGPFSSITLTYRKGLFLLTSSKALADRILSEKAGASLAKDPVFRRTFANLSSPDEAEVLFFFRPKAAIQSLLQVLPGLDPDLQDFFEVHGQAVRKALDASGLLGAEALGFTTTYQGGKGLWEFQLLAPAPRKGLLNLTGGKALDLNLLAWVPKKATTFNLTTLPVRNLYQTLLDILSAADPELGGMAVQEVKNLKERLGVDIEKDFLDQLDGSLLTYAQPQSNLMSAPKSAVLIQVKKADRFLDSLETLLGLTQGAVTLDERKDPASGLSFWEIQVDPDQLPPQAGMVLANVLAFLKPTFTFHKGFLLFSFSPSYLRKAVAQMDGKAKGDIRDRKDVQALLKSLPPKVTSLGFNDVRAQIQSLYELATGLLSMANLPPEIPLDMALLPGSDTVAKHFFPVTSYGTETPEGFQSRMVAPFGPEILVAALAGAGGGAFLAAKEAEARFGNVQAGPRKRRKPKVIRLPGKKPAPQGAKPAQAAPPKPAAQVTPAQKRRVQEDFDLLSSALVIYKVEHGQYPETLETLLQKTPDYPHGFIPGRTELPKDPWGRPYKYQRSATGYRIWSVGPNGKDEGGKGDDILRAR